MGFVVADGAADDPWIRAIMERHEWLKGKPDVGVGHWTPDEWRDLEHLHQQHHRQQQQQQEQQEQQLRQQQHQQRQNCFQCRQQQQQQYHLQQQHENNRRRQHQQHYKQEIAKKTSKAQRVEVRADGEAAQAEKGSAPPTSQTTLKPQSLCEYPAVLFASQPVCRKVLSTHDNQLESMENGLLGKPAQKEEEEKLEELIQEPEGPQQSMHAAQPRPCSSAEGAGGDEMGVLGKDLVVARGLVVTGGGAGVEEQRPPFWADGKISVWWPTPDETELEMAISYAQMSLPAVSSNNTFGGRDVDGGKVVVGDGSLVLEVGAQAPPPLLLQQQELLAPTPQEPWPPPIMAAEHEGSGAGGSGESRLERGRKDIFGTGDVLSDVHGFRESKESSGKGDESYTTDGNAWERAGIGTGRSYSSTYMGSGCEVAGRRLTRQRRARVREK